MVFNVIMVNQDDHVKNISFLMDKNGTWKLAPAYDITFSYNLNNEWLKAHQMSINGKCDNIAIEDLIAAGKKNVSESEREVNLVANLAEVSPEIIQDLDLSDYMKIQDWLKDFLSISTEQR